MKLFKSVEKIREYTDTPHGVEIAAHAQQFNGLCGMAGDRQDDDVGVHVDDPRVHLASD
jgi:hypothetical protein